MSARKWKPVRAWAVVGEQGHIAQDEGSMAWRTRLGAAPHARMTDDVVRVTLVPDGTPSQDAEVRRLKNALRAIHDVIETRGPLDESWRTFLLTQIDAALRGRRGAK